MICHRCRSVTYDANNGAAVLLLLHGCMEDWFPHPVPNLGRRKRRLLTKMNVRASLCINKYQRRIAVDEFR